MSTIEVTTGGFGEFAGDKANIVDYSVQEYGTPLSMTDLGAGVPTISFSVLEDTSRLGSMMLPGKKFVLTDPHAGVQHGVIDGGGSSDEYTLDISASGALLPLVSQREAAPYSGTLGGAIVEYLALCGITSGVQFNPAILIKHVDLPHWVGDVWNQLKKLMAIHQFEIADVAGQIIVRDIRERWVDVERYTSVNLDYGRGQASQIVEVHYNESEWVTNKQVYPDMDEPSPERAIISVQASEVTTTNYPVPMWIDSIDEPSHVTNLPCDYSGTTSVYSVVDKDGQSVSLGDWVNGGGSVSFGIGQDGRSIDVTVQGMATQSRAPYRIAGTSQDREYQYAALYIAATGIAFEEKVLWSASGASLVDAPADSITRIEDPMVTNREQAMVVLSNAVHRENGTTQVLSVESTAINRRGETGLIVYPTFGQFDIANAGQTFANFNTTHSGQTFAQFQKEQSEEYGSGFSSQAFGGIGGARVRHRNNIYRIREGSARPGRFSWNAEPDVTFEDWENESPDTGMTFTQFHSKWFRHTFEEFYRMPLA